MSTKLLTALNCRDEIHLIVDDSTTLSNLTIGRIKTILESGAKPLLINEKLHPSSVNSIIFESNEVEHSYLHSLEIVNKKFELSDLENFGRSDVDFVVDKVFVQIPKQQSQLRQEIFNKCKRLRIPINTSNSTDLSTFTVLSTYNKGSLQIGITTNNQSCKLASRIKREIVQRLPENLDVIVETIGSLKQKIKYEDEQQEDDQQVGDFNNDKNLKRSRWLSQIIDYYPLSKLAEISLDDLTDAYQSTQVSKKQKVEKKGTISLIGSGPGSLSMLTVGALNEIYNADLILADKLVPQPIIDVIPKKTELFIAKKYPGNAENAQQELLKLGLENLNKGKRIVRLKQGDPFIFGRGGEEFLFFEANGYVPKVMPGLSSALVAPLTANIPTTQRDVSDQVLICTGTGRNGKLPNLPEFEPKRTVVFLMALKKIVDVLPQLYSKNWPKELPICIVERASCPDQRVVRTTLGDLIDVLKVVGSRPPGLLVTGYSCDVLVKLKEGEKYRVEEGYDLHHDDSEEAESVSLSRSSKSGSLNKIISTLSAQIDVESSALAL
ncbi:unnamed protein product [Ambrosiozyma monospora]|uniref:Unnamed protein product n=1 Tax=Ambrosiozyma monospora TaxID=43982 RepID=A0ACB5SS19_AMBMO|nr:unnamed protein product [Ambrosiozyma monospora]